MAAACIPAAVTMGILIGFGRRHGVLWEPVNACAHLLLGDRADGIIGFHAGVTLTGVAVVLSMSVVAIAVATVLVSSRRFLHGALAAFGVALAGYLIHVNVAARSPGGLAALLSTGELRALYLSAAFALVAAMRDAFFVVREPPRSQ